MSDKILREIGTIYRALNTFSDFIMKSISLERGQFQYLMRINENPGINQQQLSEILLVDKTSTAKAVNKLVAKGYIIKKTGETDKRNFNLFLTHTGEKACTFLIKEEQFVTRKSLSTLTESNQQLLLEQLQEVNKTVASIFYGLKEEKLDSFLTEIEKEKTEQP
jgi:DNA-binding MarR family transcriptional regulator